MKNFSQGISDIISFNNFNNTSRSYKIPEIYYPTMPITVIDIYEIINKLPNQYHILTENCQNFVNNIVDSLKNKYNILIENNCKKIEECLSEINLKKNNKSNSNKSLEEIKENESEQMMPTYVDENSIYLINIFEEKKKILKNSRSDGNINFFGKYNNNNYSNNNLRVNNSQYKNKNLVLSNSYSNLLKY